MLKKKNKKVKEEEVEVNYDPADLYEEEEDLEEDGQLAVDVFQDKKNVIIKSTIAGVEPEDIDITFDNDMITIRGKRKKDLSIEEGDYFYQECYWGGFSRSIILPVDVDPERIKATIKNGVLTISLPKIKKQDINIEVEDEN
ncbi:Hsp20/alpha crystallin family protein [Candidatus Parcubacteria bacterium]|jgi:HSP20 family protein|nr:Hsp20/alpha crystallin family protein [Candidatus Parcubacteria bacterium]MBT7228172.1 Hsp20/alpha crystallin family protein [Candidatus Parcubacteria bacterium]